MLTASTFRVLAGISCYLALKINEYPRIAFGRNFACVSVRNIACGLRQFGNTSNFVNVITTSFYVKMNARQHIWGIFSAIQLMLIFVYQCRFIWRTWRTSAPISHNAFNAFTSSISVRISLLSLLVVLVFDFLVAVLESFARLTSQGVEILLRETWPRRSIAYILFT